MVLGEICILRVHVVDFIILKVTQCIILNFSEI